ncbi:probable starch synthase 4, chloroplastic/amyloplastic [Prosopis cineraria]|uniref:probable starch synthase 4, chloroplastic/amyloplastic n=1 Tax=Prosopis cineraria TaxID=364024 RepID=UPI00240EA3DB|nr:probable starch synthase 4, chloroplastic/amyloplastic [Prosopis cineraria]
MGTLVNAGTGVPSLRCIPTSRTRRTSTSFRKPIAGLPLRCLRSNGDDNRQGEQRFQGTNNVVKMQLTEDDQDAKHHHIWKLFREAQQNILYLNKQRLAATEELNKANTEKLLLLNMLEKLEAEKHAGSGKDNLSICWELLLRIDSMVLTNMISPGEASELRRLVIKHKLSVADIFTDIPGRRDSELLEELRQFSDSSRKNAFHIVHICTEMAPLVSRGSIASYVTGISCALQRKGHLVEVILPKYACLNLDEVQGLHEVKAEAYSYFNGQVLGNRAWTGVVRGIGVTLIEPLQCLSLFSREMIYGYTDDFERQVFLFSRASLDYIVKCGKKPDILHIHNWETAIVGPLFWDLILKQGLEGAKILLTCQDLSMQCLEHPDKLALCGLDPASLHRSDRLQDNTSTHLVNILKVRYYACYC